MPVSDDPELDDSGCPWDDHKQYAEDSGEEKRHAQWQVAVGAEVADFHLAAVLQDEDQ